MTDDERKALFDILHHLVRFAFHRCGDDQKIALLATWREVCEILFESGSCSIDDSEAKTNG